MQTHWITLVIIAIYLVACLVVGFWASRKQTSMHEFYLAGRRLGPIVVGLAVSSTVMSGFGWVGGFGTLYHTGLHLWVLTMGATFGTLFAYLFMAKPIRVYSEQHNMITFTDFFNLRYKSPTASLVATIGILCGMIGYLMTNMQALGKMGQVLLGIDYNVALIIGTVVLGVYCIGGGMLASALTDAFQAIMMVVSSFIFIGIALYQGGGFTHINETVTNFNINNSMFWHDGPPFNWVWALGSFAIYVFGVAAQPHVVSKFNQIQKVSKLGRCMIIGTVSYFIVGIAMYAGFASRALTIMGKFPDMTGQSDLISTTFAIKFMHPIFSGLVLGAVLAAIMSTADGIICSLSAILTKDIFLRYFIKKEKTDKQEVLIARIFSFAVIVIGFLMVLRPPTVVTWLGNGAWGLLSAVNIPLIVIGMRWKRGNKYGAIAASFVAVIVGLGLILAKFAFKVVLPVDFTIIACAASILTYVIVSLCTKPTENAIFPTASMKQKA
ncbi:MAG: sodium:solute symporter family transporter [Lachnospiraceae bacterium]|jgi:sodium/proline symporter